jgi:hypothetical protein
MMTAKASSNPLLWLKPKIHWKTVRLAFSSILVILSFYKRQKAQEAGAFYGGCDFPLVLGANPRMLGIDYFGLRGNEPAKKVDFFIVDILHIL